MRQTTHALAALASLLLPGAGQAWSGHWRAACAWQLALLAVVSALCLSRLLLTRHGLELLALAVVSLQLLAAGAAWRLPPARWRQLPQALLFALASTALALGLFMGKGPLLGVNLYYVPSPSMLPTLQVGDLILVDLWAYRRQPAAVGEIATFSLASEPERTLVKRVAALSYQGDERYYQLLGDNPVQSQDSRHFGEQPHSRLQGRVVRVLALGRRANAVAR